MNTRCLVQSPFRAKDRRNKNHGQHRRRTVPILMQPSRSPLSPSSPPSGEEGAGRTAPPPGRIGMPSSPLRRPPSSSQNAHQGRPTLSPILRAPPAPPSTLLLSTSKQSSSPTLKPLSSPSSPRRQRLDGYRVLPSKTSPTDTVLSPSHTGYSQGFPATLATTSHVIGTSSPSTSTLTNSPFHFRENLAKLQKLSLTDNGAPLLSSLSKQEQKGLTSASASSAVPSIKSSEAERHPLSPGVVLSPTARRQGEGFRGDGEHFKSPNTEELHSGRGSSFRQPKVHLVLDEEEADAESYASPESSASTSGAPSARSAASSIPTTVPTFSSPRVSHQSSSSSARFTEVTSPRARSSGAPSVRSGRDSGHQVASSRSGRPSSGNSGGFQISQAASVLEDSFGDLHTAPQQPTYKRPPSGHRKGSATQASVLFAASQDVNADTGGKPSSSSSPSPKEEAERSPMTPQATYPSYSSLLYKESRFVSPTKAKLSARRAGLDPSPTSDVVSTCEGNSLWESADAWGSGTRGKQTLAVPQTSPLGHPTMQAFTSTNASLAEGKTSGTTPVPSSIMQPSPMHVANGRHTAEVSTGRRCSRSATSHSAGTSHTALLHAQLPAPQYDSSTPTSSASSGAATSVASQGGPTLATRTGRVQRVSVVPPAQPIVEAIRKRLSSFFGTSGLVSSNGLAQIESGSRRASSRHASQAPNTAENSALWEPSISPNNSCTAKHRNFSDALIAEMYDFLKQVGSEVEGAALQRAMLDGTHHHFTGADVNVGAANSNEESFSDDDSEMYSGDEDPYEGGTSDISSSGVADSYGDKRERSSTRGPAAEDQPPVAGQETITPSLLQPRQHTEAYDEGLESTHPGAGGECPQLAATIPWNASSRDRRVSFTVLPLSEATAKHGLPTSRNELLDAALPVGYSASMQTETLTPSTFSVRSTSLLVSGLTQVAEEVTVSDTRKARQLCSSNADANDTSRATLSVTASGLTSHQRRRSSARRRSKEKKNRFPFHENHNNLELPSCWFDSPEQQATEHTSSLVLGHQRPLYRKVTPHQRSNRGSTGDVSGSESSATSDDHDSDATDTSTSDSRNVSSANGPLGRGSGGGAQGMQESEAYSRPVEYLLEAVTAEPPLFFSGMLADPVTGAFLFGGMAFLEEARVLKVLPSAAAQLSRSRESLGGSSFLPSAKHGNGAPGTSGSTPSSSSPAVTPFSHKVLVREYISVSKKHEGHMIQVFSLLASEAAATVMPSKHQTISTELTRRLVSQTLPGCIVRAFPLAAVARRTKPSALTGLGAITTTTMTASGRSSQVVVTEGLVPTDAASATPANAMASERAVLPSAPTDGTSLTDKQGGLTVASVNALSIAPPKTGVLFDKARRASLDTCTSSFTSVPLGIGSGMAGERNQPPVPVPAFLPLSGRIASSQHATSNTNDAQSSTARNVGGRSSGVAIPAPPSASTLARGASVAARSQPVPAEQRSGNSSALASVSSFRNWKSAGLGTATAHSRPPPRRSSRVPLPGSTTTTATQPGDSLKLLRRTSVTAIMSASSLGESLRTVASGIEGSLQNQKRTGKTSGFTSFRSVLGGAHGITGNGSRSMRSGGATFTLGDSIAGSVTSTVRGGSAASVVSTGSTVAWKAAAPSRSASVRKPRREPIGNEIVLSETNPALYEWALSQDPAQLQEPIDNIQAFLSYFTGGFAIRRMVVELLEAVRRIQRFMRRCLTRKRRAMDCMLRRWRSLEVESRLRLQHYHPPPSAIERIELIATNVLQQYMLTSREYKTKLIQELWQQRRVEYRAYREQRHMDAYVLQCKREGRPATAEGWRVEQQRAWQRRLRDNHDAPPPGSRTRAQSSTLVEGGRTSLGVQYPERRTSRLVTHIEDPKHREPSAASHRRGSRLRRRTSAQLTHENVGQEPHGTTTDAAANTAVVGSLYSLFSQDVDPGPPSGAAPRTASMRSGLRLDGLAGHGSDFVGSESGTMPTQNNPGGGASPSHSRTGSLMGTNRTVVFSAVAAAQQSREDAEVHGRFGWFIPPEKLLQESHKRLLASLRTSVLTVEQVQHEVKRAAAEAAEAETRAALAAAARHESRAAAGGRPGEKTRHPTHGRRGGAHNATQAGSDTSTTPTGQGAYAADSSANPLPNVRGPLTDRSGLSANGCDSSTASSLSSMPRSSRYHTRGRDTGPSSSKGRAPMFPVATQSVFPVVVSPTAGAPSSYAATERSATSQSFRQRGHATTTPSSTPRLPELLLAPSKPKTTRAMPSAADNTSVASRKTW